MVERLDPEEHVRRVRLFGAFTRWLPWTVLAIIILAGLAFVSLTPHDDTGPALVETISVQSEAQAQPSPTPGSEGKAAR